MSNELKYWIACSGGIDSVALVHIFHELKKPFGILHCNFQLRGDDSDKDEDFVRELADQLSVPVKVKRFDTERYKFRNNVNTQVAARDLRYNWFREFTSKGDVKVCLAHHKNDQVETFLLQLRRGGKVKGLSAMPLSKDGFIRPLLGYTKNQLVALCEKNAWQWREDISNSSNDYKRNLYRNKLIPEINSEGIAVINDLTEHFQYLLRVLNQEWGEEDQFGAIKFSINFWTRLPLWLKHIIISNEGMSRLPVHEIDKLCSSSVGAHFSSGNHKVWRVKNDIVFVHEKEKKLKLKSEIIPNHEIQFEDDKLYLDADKVTGELRIRPWLKSEKIQPLGMNGKKSISVYLKDKGVPQYAREFFPVLVDDTDTVLGIIGYTVAEQYKINSSTKRVVLCSIYS